jgi:hypothetical protein
MRAMPYENVHATSPDKFFLMGIIYGHYDEQASSKHINTGIAIVTPVQKILELVSKHERSIAKKHDGV